MRITDFNSPNEGPPPMEVPEGLIHPQAQVKQYVKDPHWAEDAELAMGQPWVLPLEHFSASSLHMLEICPRQWQQRYILGRKEPPGQALVLGTLTHSGIEFGLDVKMVTQADPDLDDTITYYHDAVWPQTLDRYGGEGEVIWDDKPEQVRAKGASLVTVYHPRISLLEPESVGHEFLLDLGLPVPVKGFIDCVQANDRPTIDFKTSARKVSSLKPQWRVQSRIYQLAIPRPVDFHLITTAATPQVVTGLEAEGLVEFYDPRIALQTRQRLAEGLAEANGYMARYGPDAPWPMRGLHHDWRCDWCAFREDPCPVWDRA